MALNNLLLTLVGLGAVAFLMKSDVRQSSAMLRRNLRSMRTWLEEQGVAAESAAKQDVKKVGEGGKPPDAPPKPPST